MANNRATRDAFGHALLELGKTNDRVMVVDCDLKDPTKTRKFTQEYPDRSVQCGIAEANGVGIAAGLALEGYRPFLSGFAHFMTAKYLEVRHSILYNKAGVVIVGTHAGLAIGKDGHTHMALQDTGIMRLLHGMRIIQPVDWNETVQAMNYLANETFPAYLRLGRQPVPDLTGENYGFEFGKGVVAHNGKQDPDISVFATGGVVSTALEAAEELEKGIFNIRVINMHTLSPIDEGLIVKCAGDSKGIFAVDDHYINGGLGTIIAEVVSQRGIACPVYRWGVTDEGQGGSPKDLYDRYKLDKEGLIDKILEFRTSIS